MSDPHVRDLVELPIACTLDTGDGPGRLARWRELSASGAPSVRREGRALVVAYRSLPGVHRELEALVVAERECCSFARWEVEQEGDRVVLRITSDDDGLAAIAALFGGE